MDLKIQYGGQNVISSVLSCYRSKICQKDSPHQNVFKLTSSQKSYAEKIGSANLYFYWLKCGPDEHHLSHLSKQRKKPAYFELISFYLKIFHSP